MQARSGFTAVAAAALIAAGGLFWAASGDGAAAPVAVRAALDATQLAWHEGDQQSYALQLDSTVQLGLAASGSMQDIDQRISGALHLRVFEVSADEVVVGLQLAPAHYVVAGQPVAHREAQLARPFVARFARDGAPRRFDFAPGLEAQTHQLLEEIVRTFQCVVPAATGDRWQTEEEHGSGRYQAVYVREAEGLRKEKTAYLRGAASALGGGKARVVRSAARFSLAASGSWLQRAELDDEIVTVVGGEAMARATSHGSLVAQAATGPSALAEAVDSAALLRAGAVDAGREEIPVQTLTAADRARFAATLQSYHASAGDDVNLMLALRDQIRQFPELAGLVPDIVRAGELHDRAMSGLIHVLELAGHEAAQAALGEVLGDARASHMNRIRAIIALGGVAAPTEAALAKIWAAVGNRSSDAATDLAHTALLSVGRLGDVLRVTEPRRYDEEIRGPLLAALHGSPTEEAATIALKAIGNARDRSLAPELYQNLGAPSAAVRAAAAEAVGAVDADDAMPNLVTRLRAETDGRVRSFLVNGIDKLSNTDASAFATIDSLVVKESNGDARFAMARYLVDHLEAYPQARPTLRALLETETEPRILRYVAGRLYRTGR